MSNAYTPFNENFTAMWYNNKHKKFSFWKHIPSLNAWIFSTKKPEPISITCKRGRKEKGHITNSGILRLRAGCIARTEQTTLIGTQINVNSEEFIYNPGFSLNISEISPIIYKTMHIQKKSFFWETEKDEKLKKSAYGRITLHHRRTTARHGKQSL